MSQGNRYQLIGGTNGTPQTQVLLDQLGRVIKQGDALIVTQKEIPVYWVIGVRASTDPRHPAGTQVLELGARIQMLFPPSPSGATSLTAVMVERPAEEGMGERRAEALEAELERNGVAAEVVGERLEGNDG